MDNNKKNLSIILLFIITAIYFIHIVKLPVSRFDEGTILVGAERILNGEIPHKDFSVCYAPGQFVTLAFLFKVFGTSVTTERIYDLIIKSLLSLSIFIIIRFLSSSKFALLGWVMSLIWIARSSFPAYPMYPFFLIINTSIYYMLLHLRHEKNRYVVLSAIFIAISIFFRHDLGVPAFFIFAFALLLRRITGTQASWKPLIYFVVTVIATAMPILTYYVLTSSIEFIVNDLFLFPIAFLKSRGLPYPGLARNTLPFYVFPLTSLAGIVASVILIKRKTAITIAYALLIVSLFGLACLNQVRVRSDTIHLLPAALCAIISAPVLLSVFPRILALSSLSYRVLCIMFILGFGITLLDSVKSIKTFITRTNGYVMEVVTPGIERAKYSTIWSDMKDVVPYIKNNTSANDYIYVGVKNHDKFISNDPMIYFLSERNSPTKYHEMSPGVHNTFIIQQETVNELKARPPKMVILAQRWRKEPNLSNIDQNFNIMNDYIEDNYKYKESIGIYEIWMRKTEL